MEPPDQSSSSRPPRSARWFRSVPARFVLFFGFALLLCLPLFFRDRDATPEQLPAIPERSARVETEPAPERAYPPGSPPSAADLLLAPDGNPRSDVSALADVVTNYLVSIPPLRRPALGFNEDFVRALTDQGLMGDGALRPDHPAIAEGRLLDRWGTPWFFHPISAERVEVRSAGPDRVLFTEDDLSSLDP